MKQMVSDSRQTSSRYKSTWR